jgi:lysophospholipase L1-like esterase
VVDKTKPNDSALGVLDKSDWYLSDAHAGDIAILVIGFEDAKNAQDLTQVTANLTEIIEKLQSKNMSVILIQLTDGLGILPVEMRSPFAQMYLDVSTQTQVPLVSGIFEDLWLDDTNVAPDEFHLSAQGNKLLAQKLYDLLQK